MFYNQGMLRPVPFVDGEIYHIYNRGAHKQPIFQSETDYRRFQLLLHVANNSGSVHMANLLDKYKGRSFMEIFTGEETDKPFVDVIAYCLMPNHFHLVLRQKNEGGLTKFMNKVGTGYSMYFNTKYEHSGVLFQGRFKSRHVDSDEYFRYLLAYVHLNAVDLVQPNWKTRGISEAEKVRHFINEYPFSSHQDYAVGKRPEGALLSYDFAKDFLQGRNDLEDLLQSLEKYQGPALLGQ